MSRRNCVYTGRVGVRDELAKPLIDALKARGYRAKQSPWGEVGWVDHNAHSEVILDIVADLARVYSKFGYACIYA